MNVRYTRGALVQLEEVFTYIVEHDPDAAERVIRRIRASVQVLGLYPHLGRRTTKRGVRMVVTSPYRYRVFYEVRGNEVVILHIRHGAMADPFETD